MVAKPFNIILLNHSKDYLLPVMESMEKITKTIGRSHMYWGRKPIQSLINMYKDVKEDDLVLDPFCGGGNPTIAALMKGARIIASDLNPMGDFLTRVLVQSVSTPALVSAFKSVENIVAQKILKRYEIKCPACEETAHIDFLVWNAGGDECTPEAVKIKCDHCKLKKPLKELSSAEKRRQIDSSKIRPKFWYPKNRIHSARKPSVAYHHELFTGRNLSMLAELFHAIDQTPDDRCRKALQYVFTAILYSCSNMQMFSYESPSSSRGWTAPRFYVPKVRKEKNVWKTFEERFKKFLKCRDLLNATCFARVTDSPEKFFSEGYEVLVCERDASNSIVNFGKKANYVVLDPPYNDDIEYLAFSEFWGAWLKMKFDFEREWQPRRHKEERLRNLLQLTHKNTSKSCIVSLVLAPKKPAEWNIEDCISASGYNVDGSGVFIYDNSNKRGGIDTQKDKYLILRKDNGTNTQTRKTLLKEKLYPYLRATAFLKGGSSEKVRAGTCEILPEQFRNELQGITSDILEKETIIDIKANQKAYNSLCYSLIRIILLVDKWEITYTDNALFEDKAFGIALKSYTSCDRNLPKGVAFIAKEKKRKIYFYFNETSRGLPKKQTVQGTDDFSDIHVLIISSEEQMNILRQPQEAESWPGWFFVCYNELRRRCEKIAPAKYKKIFASESEKKVIQTDTPVIASVVATITHNIPVGGDESTAKHFKLCFSAPELPRVMPGQFVMIDTFPKEEFSQKKISGKNKLEIPLDITPRAYLKRPFGIHRAFYPKFGSRYLRTLSLPPQLATVLHTVYANEFDIFYKVLEHGLGTNEMRQLKQGQKIQLIGPLGNGLDLRTLRDSGVEEVHVIGGGVGMAPLVFLVQALRFFTFRIKAFIGIESREMLKHKDTRFDGDLFNDEFTEASDDVHLYIDDLRATGVKDIYVSCDRGDIQGLIEKENFRKGFITTHYEKYLSSYNVQQKKILAITCGPPAMMQRIAKIARDNKIDLKVLMEKRMACGIGVCLSCVCRTKNNQYKRVCVDGPIFDAEEIEWQ